jgi:hypothetical protein
VRAFVARAAFVAAGRIALRLTHPAGSVP